MLDLAIAANIPIIRVTTSDVLNAPDIIEELAPGKSVAPWEAGYRTHSKYANDVFYSMKADLELDKGLYEKLVEEDKVLILINHEDADSPFAFDAGEMPVPVKLMVEALSEITEDEKDQTLLLPCFSGLTLKTMAEVVRLTIARDKELTPRGLMTTRAEIAGKLQGLEQVDLAMPFYIEPRELRAWIAHNRRYFLEAPDERLVPRGILFFGRPGVGKSQAAKFIANEFGVPLYRMDLSSSLSKWVSESEANFSRALNTLDHEEPCVLLIDEIEKLFNDSTDDSGVMPRLLSQLLWWLQEHKTRVLTVMTTNNLEALPRELYRKGRIDTTMALTPMEPPEAMDFMLKSLAQFGITDRKHTAELRADVKKHITGSTAHADAEQMVRDWVKGHKLLLDKRK